MIINLFKSIMPILPVKLPVHLGSDNSSVQLGDCVACGMSIMQIVVTGVYMLQCQHPYHPHCFVTSCKFAGQCLFHGCEEPLKDALKLLAPGEANMDEHVGTEKDLMEGIFGSPIDGIAHSQIGSSCKPNIDSMCGGCGDKNASQKQAGEDTPDQQKAKQRAEKRADVVGAQGDASKESAKVPLKPELAMNKDVEDAEKSSVKPIEKDTIVNLSNEDAGLLILDVCGEILGRRKKRRNTEERATPKKKAKIGDVQEPNEKVEDIAAKQDAEQDADVTPDKVVEGQEPAVCPKIEEILPNYLGWVYLVLNFCKIKKLSILDLNGLFVKRDVSKGDPKTGQLEHPLCPTFDRVKLKRVNEKLWIYYRRDVEQFAWDLRPFEHSSASCITIRLALELIDKPYDLPASSNARLLTIRLTDGCSKGPCCVFSALKYVKLQGGPSEHSSTSRITIRFALELAEKTYDLLASFNASRLTTRLTDGCSKGPRCVFSALYCVKLQHKSSQNSSASRITIRLALVLAGKPYDLPVTSNASQLTIRLTDGSSKGPRCIFSTLDCVKLQRGPFEHPSASRITIWLALELAGKPYDLLASSNANELTIRLADGCSKGPCYVFSTLECINLQRGPSQHPSASRIIIRLALELAGKPYDLPASFNASRLTIRLADVCSEGPRCIFSALNCVKLQRGPSEHPLPICITIRFALELEGNPYDLPASSNTSRITKRLADGCSKDPCCIFSALHCVKLQHRPSEHPSTSRITIRLALELAKPYDLLTSSNAKRLTIQLADGCSKGSSCIFSALNCVKLQRGLFEHPSASRTIIRFALEFVGRPYDLSANSNAKRITKRLADGCSEGLRCVFSALDCVKLQRGTFEHPSTSRITIQLALELAGKPYDLPASSNASRLIIRLADVCSKGPHCVFSALNCIKL
ncbi:hypothetical protein L7F22_057206 [Adiantum nelumboides]|nr:hypothetical protein [Adiantum nelumboides]